MNDATFVEPTSLDFATLQIPRAIARKLWGQFGHDEAIFWAHVETWEGLLSTSSWSPIDLSEVLVDGYRRPEPTILIRADGRALFYPGMLNQVFAESGAGKSWIAVAACAEVIRNGGTCVYVDYEDSPGSITSRLLALGLSPDSIMESFFYVHPLNDPSEVDLAGLDEWVEGCTLVVVDSVGESMASSGLDQNVDKEVVSWMRRLAGRWAGLGASVLLVDHEPKSNANKGFAIGSQRKKAAIDGHSIRVEQVVAPTRDREGRMELFCAKDRHGNYQKGELLAVVTMAPHDGKVDLRVLMPGGSPEERLLKEILKFVRANEGCNTSKIKDSVGGRSETVLDALSTLQVREVIKMTRKGNARTYTSVPEVGNED